MAAIKTEKNGLATYKYKYVNPKDRKGYANVGEVSLFVEEDVEMYQDQVKRKYNHHQKKQTSADRLDESLGMRRGKESTKKQRYKDRRHESKGARK